MLTHSSLEFKVMHRNKDLVTGKLTYKAEIGLPWGESGNHTPNKTHAHTYYIYVVSPLHHVRIFCCCRLR